VGRRASAHRRSAILWIDLEDPSEAELRNLVDVFDLADDAADGLGDGKASPTSQTTGTIST
jgi:Mg2+ and Co2+ transporter CorA